MKVNHREYIKVRQYWTFWTVDYSSPSVGATLRTGTKEQMEAEYTRLMNLSDDELRQEILGR